MARSPKSFTPVQAYEKISSYCAYQERSHKEVRNKLYEFGMHRGEVDEILTRLITDGFLNEQRFAKAFAGGKFRMKKWGRNKIIHELEAHGVAPKCIQIGLNEIDAADYRKTLARLVNKKLTETREENPFKKRNLVARFVIGKGYEPEAVWEMLKELPADENVRRTTKRGGSTD
jgi:regulatory protein